MMEKTLNQLFNETSNYMNSNVFKVLTSSLVRRESCNSPLIFDVRLRKESKSCNPRGLSGVSSPSFSKNKHMNPNFNAG